MAPGIKAAAELDRIGGRQREEGLTAAERRVADLVADGRTNREVAAARFVGERTVETHLSHAALAARRAGLDPLRVVEAVVADVANVRSPRRKRR